MIPYQLLTSISQLKLSGMLEQHKANIKHKLYHGKNNH